MVGKSASVLALDATIPPFLTASFDTEGAALQPLVPAQHLGQLEDLGHEAGLAAEPAAAELAAQLRGFFESDLVMLDDLILARRISEASDELLQMVIHPRSKHRHEHRHSRVVTPNRIVQV